MKVKPIYVFMFLCLTFMGMTVSIYLRPLHEKPMPLFYRESASKGKLIYQKYNCQSCHQLYGLGGYLGPDLTNVYSKLNGNESALIAFLKAGKNQMPVFHLTKEEILCLLAFLKSTDESGVGDPRNYKVFKNGMIEQK